MARFAQYLREEKYITTQDAAGIRKRWEYGRRLLCDASKTTPNSNLKHGVLAELLGRAKEAGYDLSEREVQRRLQCGRAYPTESQIRQVLADFRTWNDLHMANFPAYEGDPEERPHNPLETRDILAQHETQTERIDEDSRYESGGLIPREQYEGDALIPRDTWGDSTPLYAIDRWADEELELAARHTDRAQKRRFYVDSLIKAVDGDMYATLGDAERAFHGEDDEDDADDDWCGVKDDD